MMRSFLLLCLVAVSTGCASYEQSQRLKRFDSTVLAYQRAIRWGDFRGAYTVAGNPSAPMPDLAALRNIRITTYDVVSSPQPNDDVTRITQGVEIRYVYIDRMREHAISDVQTWVYSEKDERWRLESPPPEFK